MSKSYTIEKPDGTIIGVDVSESDDIEARCYSKFKKGVFYVERMFHIYTNRKKLK